MRLKFKEDGMLGTLTSLRGNARACIWTEPLWGIPFNLCTVYATAYMGEFGMTELDIGMVGSLYLLVAIFASIFSGVLTDKLGRRRCTIIFDLISWSIPELLWAFAQNKGWFFAAAMFNGLMRITSNSWGLMLVEDLEDEMVLKCNALAQLMGLITVFIMPLSGLAVQSFGLVPTMRAFYLLGFVMMTAKFVILYVMGHETKVGEQRMRETQNESIGAILWGCRHVYVHLLKEKRILLTMALIAVFQIVSRLNEYFWGPYLINTIGVAASNLAQYGLLKSGVTMLCVLLIIPRVRLSEFKRPTLAAWALFALSQVLLILAPAGGIWMLLLSAVCEGFTLSILSPVIDSMLVINADPSRRARIYGLVYGTILVPVAFFPTIAGALAKFTPSAPFLINLVMLALGAILTLALARARQAGQMAKPHAEVGA